MPALNFSSQFAPAVESGDKLQTIRRVRKHPIRAGDRLVLYTGMRTPACRKLREARCIKTTPIRICPCTATVYLNDRRLSRLEAARVARRDGFGSLKAFCEWFRETYRIPYGHFFEGVLIGW